MQEVINVVVQNGVGVGSFVALLYYIFKHQDKSDDTLKEISTTMSNIDKSLATLTDRVDKIEERISR